MRLRPDLRPVPPSPVTSAPVTTTPIDRARLGAPTLPDTRDAARPHEVSDAAPAATHRPSSMLSVRLGRLFHEPALLAVDELTRFVRERMAGPAAPREARVLEKRLVALRQELEALPPAERAGRLQQALFWGEDFPTVAPGEYRAGRAHFSLGALGALGALTNPVTALLLPLAIKAGFDVGRALQPTPHFIADEWVDRVLADRLPGETATATPTFADYLAWYDRNIADQKAGQLGGLRAYVLAGLPHHITEGSVHDRVNRDPFFDSTYMQDVSAGLPWIAAAALLHPLGGLAAGAATAASAALYEPMATHRAAHRPLGEMSLLELSLQAAGWITSREQHAVHHRPMHDRAYTGATPSVDRAFDDHGLGQLANFLAYVTTGTVPNTWRRDPARAAFLGVDLSGAETIAAAKAALVQVHKALVSATKGGDLAVLDAVAGQTGDPQLDAVLTAAAQTAGVGPEASVFALYARLRRLTDGVELTPEQLGRALRGGPLETKFVSELSLRAPAEAWPKLDHAQVRAALARLRAQYEPR